MNFQLARLPSPIGEVLLVFDGEIVRALDFHDYEARMHQLLRLHYGAYSLTPAEPPAAVAQAIQAYFAGDLTALDRIAVQTGGTDFQRLVWAALRRIPAGATTSYGRLAAQIGRPGASRAVGLANGANPVSIVVPCHRVIGANASLTGYGGGLGRKAWLLAHESPAPALL
ncbi:MAG: methylated-DNA--[protein]-cysteine S-methyltransferase [Acetobacteraceae bacterium]